jgi:hypothetical protein
MIDLRLYLIISFIFIYFLLILLLLLIIISIFFYNNLLSFIKYLFFAQFFKIEIKFEF